MRTLHRQLHIAVCQVLHSYGSGQFLAHTQFVPTYGYLVLGHNCICRYESEYGLLLVGTNIIITPVPLLFGILIPMGCNTCLYVTLCCRRSKRHLHDVQTEELAPKQDKYQFTDSSEKPGAVGDDKDNLTRRVLAVMSPSDDLHVEDLDDADPATGEEMTISEAKQLMATQERRNAELRRKLSDAERKAARLEKILDKKTKEQRDNRRAGRGFSDFSAMARESESLEEEARPQHGNSTTPLAQVPRLSLRESSEQRRRRPRIGQLAAERRKELDDGGGTGSGNTAAVNAPADSARDRRHRVPV